MTSLLCRSFPCLFFRARSGDRGSGSSVPAAYLWMYKNHKKRGCPVSFEVTLLLRYRERPEESLPEASPIRFADRYHPERVRPGADLRPINEIG